jgi:hypothetical protein
MKASSETPDMRKYGPRYFRSFASYKIPLRPDGPIEFAGTEGLKSFYIAYYDSAERLIQFDKIWVVRAEKEPREIPLAESAEPGETIYFEAIASEPPAVGRPIRYADTESLDGFFAGIVDASGQMCQAIRYRKDLFFSDAYEYWPNGRMRKRIMNGGDKPQRVVEYDRDGKQVKEQIAALSPEQLIVGSSH